MIPQFTINAVTVAGKEWYPVSEKTFADGAILCLLGSERPFASISGLNNFTHSFDLAQFGEPKAFVDSLLWAMLNYPREAWAFYLVCCGHTHRDRMREFMRVRETLRRKKITYALGVPRELKRLSMKEFEIDLDEAKRFIEAFVGERNPKFAATDYLEMTKLMTKRKRLLGFNPASSDTIEALVATNILCRNADQIDLTENESARSLLKFWDFFSIYLFEPIHMIPNGFILGYYPKEMVDRLRAG